ncbi:hypothetical protein sphantq_04685 (plasmid) [Sphingobium sp. AntQ-1]|nr:hypothetical protein sphantq_04685 [Sphingobium sp. AntQ-1]
MDSGSKDTRAALAELTPKDRVTALARFSQLHPHLEEGKPLLAVCREAGLAYRIGRRWRQLYLDHGLSGLVRRPRNDRHTRRAMPPDPLKLAEGLALQRPASRVREITRTVEKAAAERGVFAPSYRTVARIVGAISPALVSLAHDGPKIHSHRYDLVHRHEADRPNALWQAAFGRRGRRGSGRGPGSRSSLTTIAVPARNDDRPGLQ